MDSPLELPDCTLWLDARDGLSGSGNWLDKSGNANHATKGVSPTVDPTGINGFQALLFSRAAHSHLDLPPYIFETGRGTTFAVAKIRTFLTSGTQAAFLLSAQTEGSGADRWRWYLFAAPGSLNFSAGGNTNGDPAPVNMATPALADTPYVMAARSDGTTQLFRTSCPEASRTNTYSLAGAAPRVVIGRINTDSDSEEWDGWVGEIIHYDRALDTDDLLEVYAYLQRRWDIRCGGEGWKVGRVSMGG